MMFSNETTTLTRESLERFVAMGLVEKTDKGYRITEAGTEVVKAFEAAMPPPQPPQDEERSA